MATGNDVGSPDSAAAVGAVAVVGCVDADADGAGVEDGALDGAAVRYGVTGTRAVAAVVIVGSAADGTCAGAPHAASTVTRTSKISGRFIGNLL
jgi:hypothetical protein